MSDFLHESLLDQENQPAATAWHVAEIAALVAGAAVTVNWVSNHRQELRNAGMGLLRLGEWGLVMTKEIVADYLGQSPKMR